MVPRPKPSVFDLVDAFDKIGNDRDHLPVIIAEGRVEAAS
jgi:hypothetical protein